MISLKIFVFNDFQENTYILSDETNQCIIVDPGCNNDEEKNTLATFIFGKGLSPKAVLNTHCHIDHILGVKFVCDKYKIPFIAHKDDDYLVKNALSFGSFFGLHTEQPPMPDSYLEEGNKYSFGNSELIFFNVPGHSPGSLVIYSPADKILITGDVLFKNSIGRTDLPGGDYNALINGIRTKLLSLPEETMVFPGHGPYTTIGDEIKSNPFLNQI